MNNISKDIKDFNTWNRSIKDRLIEFVYLMKHPIGSGGYYYSLKGDRFSFPLLCSTVFATKIFLAAFIISAHAFYLSIKPRKSLDDQEL